MNKKLILALLLAADLLTACEETPKEKTAVKDEKKENAPASINYAITATYPHDINSFTEGLLIHDGKLFESTGSPAEMPQTRSLVGVVDLKTGKLDEKVEIDREYFGEGIVFLNDKLYQLTYQAKVGFIYDAKTFSKIGQFAIPSKEGWGMTTDGTHLIMSDGTNKLTYLEPSSFKVVKTVSVTDNNGGVDNLNELEYIKGFIYANVYTTNFIVKIDPATGKIVGRMNFNSLAQDAKSRNRNSLEMNGIAFDSTSGKVYITGKFWPSIYELKFNY